MCNVIPISDSRIYTLDVPADRKGIFQKRPVLDKILQTGRTGKCFYQCTYTEINHLKDSPSPLSYVTVRRWFVALDYVSKATLVFVIRYS